MQPNPQQSPTQQPENPQSSQPSQQLTPEQATQQSHQLNIVEREPMKWLFTAEFSDGSVIVQDQEDKCKTRDDGTGSTFTDVLAREDDLVAFHLYHEDGQQAATVDLLTGAFVINGTPFHAHDQYFEPTQHKLRLVYFRESRVENDVFGVVQEDGTVKETHGLNPRHYVNRYFIGWQTTVNGKNKQVTIAVG